MVVGLWGAVLGELADPLGAVFRRLEHVERLRRRRDASAPEGLAARRRFYHTTNTEANDNPNRSRRPDVTNNDNNRSGDQGKSKSNGSSSHRDRTTPPHSSRPRRPGLHRLQLHTIPEANRSTTAATRTGRQKRHDPPPDTYPHLTHPTTIRAYITNPPQPPTTPPPPRQTSQTHHLSHTHTKKTTKLSNPQKRSHPLTTYTATNTYHNTTYTH